MRLTVCALSAVLMSGCSWLGMGGGYGDTYGYDNYGSGYGGTAYHTAGHAGCAPQMQVEYYVAAQPGCAPGQGYSVQQSGYGSGYGMGAGQNAMAGYGAAAYSGTGYGAATTATTLSAYAPYGAASGVQTVQGAPLYVQQGGYSQASYGGGYAYAGQGGGYGGKGLRVGLEASIGTSYSLNGDVFPGEVSKPFLGGPGTVSDIDPIGYDDAFGESMDFGLAATYDLNRSTTLIGQVGYSKADGQRVQVGTVDNGAGTTEDLFAEFGDLEQFSLEGGLRRYMGRGGYSNVRPYVGATAGFVNTKSVDLTQSSTTLVDPTLFTQEYVDGGWSPTASGVIGAEWAMGPRSAIGIETGIRWTDDLDTNFKSDARYTIPVKLRGRVAF